VQNDLVENEELMLAYAEGNANAFDMLYRRHKNSTFRFIKRQCRCQKAIAEELFQDLWMSVIKSASTYRVEAKFTTWLYRIAHNRLITYYRKQGREFNVSLDENESDVEEPKDLSSRQPENIVVTQEALDKLQKSIEALSIEQREVFLMKYEADLSIEEIAEVVGCGHETAKSRLRYAHKKIRGSR